MLGGGDFIQRGVSDEKKGVVLIGDVWRGGGLGVERNRVGGMQPPERTGRATQKSRSALRRESGGAKGTVTWSARGQFHDPLCIHEGRTGGVAKR